MLKRTQRKQHLAEGSEVTFDSEVLRPSPHLEEFSLRVPVWCQHHSMSSQVFITIHLSAPVINTPTHHRACFSGGSAATFRFSCSAYKLESRIYTDKDQVLYILTIAKV